MPSIRGASRAAFQYREKEKSSFPGPGERVLELSNRMVKAVLVFRHFEQTQPSQVSRLSVILGEQQDYVTLKVNRHC